MIKAAPALEERVSFAYFFSREANLKRLTCIGSTVLTASAGDKNHYIVCYMKSGCSYAADGWITC
jgi:hypothetical protein